MNLIAKKTQHIDGIPVPRMTDVNINSPAQINLWMQIFFTCFSFFICAFIPEKRENVVYPKIFDVLVSDWLNFVINIHEKSYLRRKSNRCWSCEDVSQVMKLSGALEAAWKTLGRRTAKEKVAPQLQPKVRVASKTNLICSVKSIKFWSIVWTRASSFSSSYNVPAMYCACLSLSWAFFLQTNISYSSTNAKKILWNFC